MNSQLKERLDKFVSQEPGYKTAWFVRFFEMLDKCDVSDEKISEAMDFAFSKENLDNVQPLTMQGCNQNRCPCMDTKKGQETRDEFFGYLTQKAKEMGKDDYRKFLERAISQMKVDLEEYNKIEHNSSQGQPNFINLFLRNLVKENCQDVTIEKSRNHFGNVLEAVIGGLEIGHIHYDKQEANIPTIAFDEFRILTGMEKMGLGSYLFNDFCKDVAENYPKHSVIATNVSNNGDGRKTYTAWGAHAIDFDINMEDESIIIKNTRTEEEVDALPYKDGHVYLFTPENIAMHARKENTRYGKSCKCNEML